MSESAVDQVSMHPTIIVAGVGAIAAGITGFFAWASGRNSSVAVLQNALTEGFKALNEQQNAKIAALHKELLDLETHVSDLKSQMAGLEQRNLSLVSLLRRNGIDIPRATTVATVFAPYPELPSEPINEGNN